MSKLLQINICSAMLSTGKIVEDISKVAIRHGWEPYTAWGRFAKPSVSTQIRIGGKLDTYLHFAAHKLFDREGLASKSATRKLISQIEEIKPDIIHLHNIHDHYLNYPLLFEYFATIDTPIIWTQHDCWAFTGGCMYYDLQNCYKWQTGCKACPENRAKFGDTTEMQYTLKRDLLSRIKNLTFVPVSDWLGNALRQSHQKDRPIITIHNGIDVSLFHSGLISKDRKDSHENIFRIIGVAAIWDKRKGLDDFVTIRSMLSSDYEITLVGLTSEQVKSLPQGIKGITRTTNVQELLELYSDADVFVNPTYSDNFPTTNIEALACGTPVLTHNNFPFQGPEFESIEDGISGTFYEYGNIDSLANSIVKWFNLAPSRETIRKNCYSIIDNKYNPHVQISLLKSILKR